MKLFHFLLCSILSVGLLYGQKPPIKFGDISIEDLKMKSYEKDSSAAAVVLADYGESIIEYNQGKEEFEIKFERIQRIKIFTKDGLEHANFTIPLYHSGGDSEKLAGLKAATYNLENGKVVETKMKNDGVFKEKFDSNIDITKVTLPNVREGSIVEITYKVNSDFLFNFQDWEFQSTIPIVLSEYRARIPEYFNYDKYMQGYVVLDVNEQTQTPGSINFVTREREGDRNVQTTFTQQKIEFQEKRFRWVAKNVPAFKAEPYITSSRDYTSKINFELAYTQFPNSPIKRYMGSWDDINKQYAESDDFFGVVSGNGYLKKTADEITAGITDSEQKLIALTNYVKQNVAWDGTSRKFSSQNPRKTLDEKKGSSADINLLLASLLDKAGFSVYPVLTSTRDHGFIREATPVSSQFNYVICMVAFDNKSMLLDATEKLLPIGMLPERCLNGSGFAVSKSGYKWVPLQSKTKSKITVNADLTLTTSADLTGKLQIDRSGYDALACRKKYFSKDEAEYVKDFVGSRSWEITKTEIVNAKEIHQPIKEKYELAVSEHIMAAGNVYYLNPLLLYRISENPFKLENREYPVDFSSPFERIFMCRITLPEGFLVDELPQAKVMVLPENAGRYTYSVTQAGNVLNIVSNFQINKSIFVQAEYPNLREFYNQVVAKQAEQVVLKKK
ncbi:MAG: DUF3857 domain-containing protein [Cyclobacteriaceae bacterium]|nr:DUF3857 domain-containing protein [Cyclobacteriaceae bacterium]